MNNKRTLLVLAVWFGTSGCKNVTTVGIQEPKTDGSGLADASDGGGEVAAADGSGGGKVGSLDAADPGGFTEFQWDVDPVKKVDLLVMVDNSSSTQDKQALFQQNFPSLIQTLRDTAGNLPDLHIGVIDSDLGGGGVAFGGGSNCDTGFGDRGAFGRQVSGSTCGLTDSSNYIKSAPVNGQIVTNFSATRTIEDVFKCMANVGTSGCGLEHQLLAPVVALKAMEQTGGDFLRPDSLLAVLIMTDEDDCSASFTSTLYTDQTRFDFTKVDTNVTCALAGHLCDGNPIPQAPFEHPIYDSAGKQVCTAAPGGDLTDNTQLIDVDRLVDELKIFRPQADRLVVSALAGWSDEGGTYKIAPIQGGLLDLAPVCTGPNASLAYPGIRIKKFVDAFGANGSFNTVCTNDYSPALQRVAELIKQNLEPGCLPPLVDTDANTPGLQPVCQVYDRLPLDTGGFQNTLLANCADAHGASPCWNFELSRACMEQSAGPPNHIAVQRNGAVPAGLKQLVRCETCRASPGQGGLGCPCTTQPGECSPDTLVCDTINKFCVPKP